MRNQEARRCLKGIALVVGLAICVSPRGVNAMSHITTTHVAPGATQRVSVDRNPMPPYEKWARIAADETKKMYPNASIVDFEHVGRSEISGTAAVEVFKLWIVQQSHEQGLFVKVSFEKRTERFLRVQFEPTTE